MIRFDDELDQLMTFVDYISVTRSSGEKVYLRDIYEIAKRNAHPGAQSHEAYSDRNLPDRNLYQSTEPDRNEASGGLPLKKEPEWR